MVQPSFDLDFNREVVELHSRFTLGFESLETKQYWWSYCRSKYPIQCMFLHADFQRVLWLFDWISGFPRAP